MTPFLLLGLLASWLVVQNVTLLVLWSWPVLPPLLAVARTLLKVAGILALQLAPAALVVGGVAMFWMAARKTASPNVRSLREVRHG